MALDRKQARQFRKAANEWPEPIASSLIAQEEERERRDRKRVLYCPMCGRNPEYTAEQHGRHIYSLHCEKCQARFTIHIVG
jgi:formate dehydrogenase maturation protein FdhE